MYIPVQVGECSSREHLSHGQSRKSVPVAVLQLPNRDAQVGTERGHKTTKIQSETERNGVKGSIVK